MRVEFHVRTKERRERVRLLAEETRAILAAAPPAGKAPPQEMHPWLAARAKAQLAHIDPSTPLRLSPAALASVGARADQDEEQNL